MIAPVTGDRISLDEIREVMADTGYSADQRKGWLKNVLTDLAQQQTGSPSSARSELIETVKQIIDDNQSGKPIARDVL